MMEPRHWPISTSSSTAGNSSAATACPPSGAFISHCAMPSWPGACSLALCSPPAACWPRIWAWRETPPSMPTSCWPRRAMCRPRGKARWCLLSVSCPHCLITRLRRPLKSRPLLPACLSALQAEGACAVLKMICCLSCLALPPWMPSRLTRGGGWWTAPSARPLPRIWATAMRRASPSCDRPSQPICAQRAACVATPTR